MGKEDKGSVDLYVIIPGSGPVILVSVTLRQALSFPLRVEGATARAAYLVPATIDKEAGRLKN